MKSTVGKAGLSPAKVRSYATSAIAVVVAVGLAGSALAGMNAALINRDMILSRARTAANAFSAEDIKTLSGSSKDLDNKTYQSLKGRLARIRQDNPGTRFSYLLGLRNQQAYFLVDSEQPGSRGYSPPGQAYTEATPELLVALNEGDTSFVEGPVTDSYGTWFSALAPVVDQTNGQTVAMLGIDMPARDYYLQIALYALIPLLLATIPLLVLLRNRRLEAKEREITNLKTQFVSVASHELRSPLTGTLWGAQSLLKTNAKSPLTAEQHQTLTSIYNNTAASIATVNEILDFSIFERNSAKKLQRDPVNLGHVLRDTEKLFALTAQEAHVKFVYVGSWPKRVTIYGDPNALKRAFSNIFSNAIKYSPAGGVIELAYRREKNLHIVGVRDHGIGIPRSAQRKVLRGYYRAANATKVKTHGTGMGLWVTDMIIKQHRGKLQLDSQVGRGTTVFISLPTD